MQDTVAPLIRPWVAYTIAGVLLLTLFFVLLIIYLNDSCCCCCFNCCCRKKSIDDVERSIERRREAAPALTPEIDNTAPNIVLHEPKSNSLERMRRRTPEPSGPPPGTQQLAQTLKIVGNILNVKRKK